MGKASLKMTEAHGAQVLPDPDYGLKYMIRPHLNRPSVQHLFYKPIS
jgi:hypothetical protein